MTTPTTTRDSDYYRRLGGYQGPIKLTLMQVGCPRCEAAPGEPCNGTNGPIKSLHPERSEFRDELNARAAADTATGRWYRHQFRLGLVPMPPKPCGTFAAYQRHKRNGETIDDACREAARTAWRLAKAT